jgi:hypothetical protein
MPGAVRFAADERPIDRRKRAWSAARRTLPRSSAFSIIDHEADRERALAAYARIRNA